jgi:hypothetical protein
MWENMLAHLQDEDDQTPMDIAVMLNRQDITSLLR